MANIGRIIHFDVDLALPLKQVHAAPMIEGDRLADVIEIALNNHGEAVDPSGLTAVANAELSGQDGVTVRNPGTVSGGKITIPLVAECYAVPGSIRISVTLTSGTTTRTVLLLTGYVEQNGTGIIIDPSGSIPSYDDLAQIIAQMEAKIEQADEAIVSTQQAAQTAEQKAGLASTAAADADAAAAAANQATAGANAAASSIDGMTVSETVVDYGAGVNANLTKDAETGAYHLAIQTERGPQGKAYTILGDSYDTLADLQATVTAPDVGDQYNVGTAPPYHVYRWTGTVWEDQGELQGAPGQSGATFTPSVSGDGTISWTNDAGLPNPTSQSIKGATGTTFTPSVSADGMISWTNDGGLDNPPSQNIKGPKGDTPSVNGVDPDASGNVTVTGTDIPVSTTDEMTVSAALAGKQAAINDSNAEAVRTALGLESGALSSVQRGSAVIEVTANNTSSVNITFQTPFAANPQLVASLTTSNPQDRIIGVNNITTTGATIAIYNGTTYAGNLVARWIAVL